MRVDLPGLARRDRFSISFEGRDIDAWPGESVAAALINAGEAAMRTTAGGAPRGLWCGMGVCGECRVVIDGEVARACMAMARPGQVVARAPARTASPPAAEGLEPDTALTPDVLVIGAGPAGLAAARGLARAGLAVIVADERNKAGGQYFKQPGTGFAVDEARLDRQSREGGSWSPRPGLRASPPCTARPCGRPAWRRMGRRSCIWPMGSAPAPSGPGGWCLPWALMSGPGPCPAGRCRG
ncbi:FAD-binding protein [Sphingomonas changnyeongensis]|uniref:FAD-binding protein n=1 Tax=Sphingomonas changnyeongensis TaxID=2698679 RepID=A0A7Z2S9C9_9SPHN|nr:(2Fe-2S)-binding protein [Sphingomonas changnyeongensis]QHL91617.1 FAD-binding protein [Sphingomonas changnyeongensis]